MSGLFASGHAVDIVLAVMMLEALWLVIIRRRASVTVALTILPGAMILLGLRAALTGMDWNWVALALTVSLPLHMADLRHRQL